MHTVVYDYQTFSLQKYGGISRYFCELATRVERSGDLRARVIAPLHYNDYLARAAVPTTGLYVPMVIPRTSRLYRAANSVMAPLLMRAARPGIVHQTYYHVQKPPVPNARTVVTVLDMIHELYPQHFHRSDPTTRNKRACIERADHVICISESTKVDLVRLFAVPPEKISVTWLASSSEFAQTPRPSVRGTGREYLLYVGQRGGYKNFAASLEAYASSNTLRSSFDFVVFGGAPISSHERALFTRLGLRPDAVQRRTGSDLQLAQAYRDARAFVYPSLYEGFGIPPLEAMNSGCPVACSNVSSIPEVTGAAAEYFDPADVGSIASALERACLGEERRNQLVKAGYERAALFSWERCAQETLATYRRLLDASSRDHA